MKVEWLKWKSAFRILSMVDSIRRYEAIRPYGWGCLAIEKSMSENKQKWNENIEVDE